MKHFPTLLLILLLFCGCNEYKTPPPAQKVETKEKRYCLTAHEITLICEEAYLKGAARMAFGQYNDSTRQADSLETFNHWNK